MFADIYTTLTCVFLLNKLQVIKAMLQTQSMKIVRRSTRHHNNKKLTLSDSAERNPRTSGMRKIELRDIKKFFRARMPQSGILALPSRGLHT
jgi:hypothetical protein